MNYLPFSGVASGLPRYCLGIRYHIRLNKIVDMHLLSNNPVYHFRNNITEFLKKVAVFLMDEDFLMTDVCGPRSCLYRCTADNAALCFHLSFNHYCVGTFVIEFTGQVTCMNI